MLQKTLYFWFGSLLWLAVPSVGQKVASLDSRLEFAHLPNSSEPILWTGGSSKTSLLPGVDVCPIEWVNQVSEWEEPSLAADGVPRAIISQPNSPTLVTDAQAFVFLNSPRDSGHAEVVLKDLFGDGTRLEGLYVRARSERVDGAVEIARGLESGAGGGASTPDFRFIPDTTAAVPCYTDVTRCPRFDAVNVYYHADRFARDFWVDYLGLNIELQADVTVHQSGDGAYAATDGNVMKFRLGDIFMKNAALSTDLVLHEYTHLVASSLGFNATSEHSDQVRALTEAYADYFTATYTNDPRIGEWVVTCPDRQQCVGPENDTEMRTLELDTDLWNWRYGFPADNLEYGFCLRFHTSDLKCKASFNNFADRYVWGMIWAATLWDLRARVGPEVVDVLALQALRRHSLAVGFVEATKDLVDVEQELFGGAFKTDLYEVFQARGFILPRANGVDETPNSPALTIQAWPNPAADVLQISFDSMLGGSLMLFDVLGRRVVRQRIEPGTNNVTVSVSNLSPGPYLAVLRSGAHSEQFVITVFR